MVKTSLLRYSMGVQIKGSGANSLFSGPQMAIPCKMILPDTVLQTDPVNQLSKIAGKSTEKFILNAYLQCFSNKRFFFFSIDLQCASKLAREPIFQKVSIPLHSLPHSLLCLRIIKLLSVLASSSSSPLTFLHDLFFLCSYRRRREGKYYRVSGVRALSLQTSHPRW